MTHQDLRQNTAFVRSPSPGTGFFIGNDGTLLTSFHVIGDTQTGRVYSERPTVLFDGEEYPARIVKVSPTPQLVDAAILQLDRESLPPGAVLLPLFEWRELSGNFVSFGFRPPDAIQGLHASGKLQGRTLKKQVEVLQLESQSLGAREIRPGMSGAPVMLAESRQVIGMVCCIIVQKDEYIPIAFPLDQIAPFWPPLKERMQEERLLTELLEKVFSSEDWFPKVAFRSFYEKLPLPKRQRPEGQDDLPRALIDQLRGRGRVYHVINCLRERRPDIPLADLIEIPNVQRINFVNRDPERNEACGHTAVAYLLFDAPCGYGKTELLKVVEYTYFRDNWFCIPMEVKERDLTARQLAKNILAAAGDATPEEMDHLRVWDLGMQLGGCVKGEVKRLRMGGVVMTVDNIERLPTSEVKPFINEFVYALYSGLRPIKFHVRLAGRYTHTLWRNAGGQITFNVRTLTPFRLRYVRETLRRLAPAQKWLPLRAAYLMYLTGGHPGCMSQIIEQLNFDQHPEGAMSEHEPRYRQLVLENIEAIRRTIPENLREPFDVLSIFRRYSYRQLNKILERELIHYPGGADELEHALTATYFVRRSGGFIQDDIVRRLLALRMYWQAPDRFCDLSAEARDLYAEELQAGSRRPAIIVAEALYQELQYRYHACDGSTVERQRLRDEFFAPEGLVDSYLHYLESDPDPHDAKENFLALLQNEGEADWELRFAFNFYLRDTDYDEAPFEALCERAQALL